jgi:hypothetical protein
MDSLKISFIPFSKWKSLFFVCFFRNIDIYFYMELGLIFAHRWIDKTIFQNILLFLVKISFFVGQKKSTIWHIFLVSVYGPSLFRTNNLQYWNWKLNLQNCQIKCKILFSLVLPNPKLKNDREKKIVKIRI